MIAIFEQLHEWYLYWRSSTYYSGERWRQKEFSKLIFMDKNGESY